MADDLISRKAAIEALMEFDKKLRKINWYRYPYTEHECRGVDKAIVKIANLPSAEPEIIRCKDCKHGAPNGRYGCRVYHYKRYETHDMKPDDFCSFAERRSDG